MSVDVERSQVVERVGQTLIPTLLAVATVVSTATKLRLSGVPLGVGELLLITWLASSFMLRSLRPGFTWRTGFALRWGSLFMLVTSCTLLAGAFLAKVAGVTSMYDTIHEAMGWAFIFVLLAWFLLESGSPASMERFLLGFAAFGTLAASGLLVGGVLSRIFLGSQAFWYFGFRLSGWSENPNQLAALLAPLPFLAWHFRGCASQHRRRAWTVSIIGTILAGLATQSDALYLAWVVGAGALMLNHWLRGILGRERTVRSIVINAMVLPLLLIAMLTPVARVLWPLVESAIVGRAGEGGQAGTRMTLWQNGLEAAMRSPLVGWGPGSHSGLTQAFHATESHSTYIDLAAQAGLLTSLCLLGLIAFSIYMAIRRRWQSLAVAVLAVAVMAAFHNVLRQPVFWFTVFGVLAAACNRSQQVAPATDSRGLGPATM